MKKIPKYYLCLQAVCKGLTKSEGLKFELLIKLLITVIEVHREANYEDCN